MSSQVYVLALLLCRYNLNGPGPIRRIALECELIAGRLDSRRYVISDFCTLYDTRRFVIESPHERR
jgi:hypothetical protein